MLINPSALALITTYQCTAACDHCCFSCSPRQNKYIPHERMESLIDEAAEIPSMRLITFTGGECFLLGDDLDRLVERATNNGLSTRCVSNAYWATSAHAAENRIEPLVRAGLKEINYSTGGIHMKHVPVERVVHATHAALNAGLDVLINAEEFIGSQFTLEMLTKHPLLEKSFEDNRVKLIRSNWIKTDGKNAITHPPDRSRFTENHETACTSCLDAISVTPEMDLMACCGFTMRNIPELVLGSVRERRLQDVLASEPDDFLKVWIHIEGPEKILEFVKARLPGYELPAEAVHPCETCRRLYHDDTAMAVIKEHYTEEEKRINRLYFVDLASKALRQRSACQAETQGA